MAEAYHTDDEATTIESDQNPSSPYYLHPGENPGTILVSPPLDGVNYHAWSGAMKRALLSKNKFKFVNGLINVPDLSDSLYDAWERCNTMVVSWITRSVSQQIAQSIIYVDSAQELWEDLKDRFSKGDYFRTSDLLQDIHSMKQGDRNVSGFFTDLKTLWEELESLRPTPSCTCIVRCTCELMKTIKRHKDSEYVICFLKGLNDQFSTIKAQILLMEPLPPINKVFSLVLQQERQLGGLSLGESKILFNAAEASQNWKSSQGRGMNSNGRAKGIYIYTAVTNSWLTT